MLRRARHDIGADKLRSLGIEDMQARRGITGSYVLEIPGPTRESRAEALAAEMRRVFAGGSTVRIDRPAAAVRIRGLDEAMTTEEVVAAIADRGVAGPEEIRASISRPTFGMGMAWVRWSGQRTTWLRPPASEWDGRPPGWNWRQPVPSTASGVGGRGMWPAGVGVRRIGPAPVIDAGRWATPSRSARRSPTVCPVRKRGEERIIGWQESAAGNSQDGSGIPLHLDSDGGSSHSGNSSSGSSSRHGERRSSRARSHPRRPPREEAVRREEEMHLDHADG